MRKLFVCLGILAIAFVVFLALFGPAIGMGPSIYWAQLTNVREIATPPAELLAAKARWTANPIKHYRLTVRYLRTLYPAVDCLQDVEVLNEVVITTYEDNCSTDGYLQRFAPLGKTVAELFAKFQKETTTIHFSEEQGCGDFMVVALSYDSAGYPTSAKYHFEQAFPWNLGSQTYKALYGDGPKTESCFGGINSPSEPDITVSLHPS